MLSDIFRLLRRRKSQPRAVLVPPDPSRDSFASPFPHVSEGGYTLYYELELLQRKRAEKEMQKNITISAPRPFRAHTSSSSYSHAQTPGASSSHHHSLRPPSMSQQHQNARRHDTTKAPRSRRSRLEKTPEGSPGRPRRSVRKRKKIKNFRQVMETQAAEQQRTMILLTDQTDTPGTALSRLASSSCGHGTMDTPPTTVEDLIEDELGAVVNFKKHDDRSDRERVDANSRDPFDSKRPESISSYHTAMSHFSDT
ncbi:hypothetical protein C0995_009456 [Termitomyces sp. Mi166|nr:hypothetical protein C0995_009456 [Termitomyces sp. Mi166\